MATIRERTDWQARDGKPTYLVDYNDGRKRRFKQFKRKKDAERFLRQVQNEIDAGTHVADGASVTVGKAASLWLERCRNGTAEDPPLERSTVVTYARHVRLYIDNADYGIGHILINKLDLERVRAFESMLLEQGKSRALIRKIRASLSALISDAIERKLVGRHVLREAVKRKRRRSARDTKRPIIPTKAEITAMLASATGSFRPLFITALFTGMRGSELRGLRWSDVDFEAREIHVRQRADAWNAMGSPKSEAGVRDIPLAPLVANTLREWRLACPNGELDLVFPSGTGQVQSWSNIVNRDWARLQLAAGVSVDSGKKDKAGRPVMKARYGGMHVMRHACASLLIEQGLTPKRIQVILGHASIAMTYDTYGALFKSPEDDQAAMAQIQARLVG